MISARWISTKGTEGSSRRTASNSASASSCRFWRRIDQASPLRRLAWVLVSGALSSARLSALHQHHAQHQLGLGMIRRLAQKLAQGGFRLLEPAGALLQPRQLQI